MIKNLEKLLTLVKIAKMQGWSDMDNWEEFLQDYVELLPGVLKVRRDVYVKYDDQTFISYTRSLNDLFNFLPSEKENKKTFIDCLCSVPLEESKHGLSPLYPNPDKIMVMWYSTATIDRLDTLFSSFKHLL